MGESACLVHSFSYTASISHESHEDNPLHALSQSISFGRFMTESLEWGKWSSFSHKKYVEEAEKFSRPGSVAQKKAFFEAHYKRIAEAKKAAAAAANESPEQQAADAAESGPAQKQEVKEHASEIGSAAGTDGSGLDVEKNEPRRKSIQMDATVSEKDAAVKNLFHKAIAADDNKASDDVMVPDEMEERENYSRISLRKSNGSFGNKDEVKDEDGELSKKRRSIGDKDEARRSITKNSSGWRVSVEISVPPRTSDAAKRISFSENRSETMAAHNSPKKDERPVRQRFGFLNCLIKKSKTQDQNATRKKGRKQEKKPKKRSMCLCFKPQAVGETEAPRKHTKKVKGKSQNRKL